MGNLSIIDVCVIFSLMAGVTWFGHVLSGSVVNRSQFFNAGGGLPWWAVSTSIIATVVSSVTFISVPAAVFNDGGNLTYIQMIIGLALGKIVTSWLFAEPYYSSRGVTTTYDYIGKRIGPKAGQFSMLVGLVLNLISTAVKLLTTALVLSVMTDWSLPICCLIIIIFSILWSWLAGLKTVIWTDFLLFLIFALGALFSVIWMFLAVDMPMGQALQLLDENAKTALFDLSVDPHITYTLWAGIIGSITLSLSVAGGQGTLQRIRACRSVADAKKAYSFAALFYVLHLLILLVGIALWLFYNKVGIPAELAEQLVSQPDRIFPYFIMTEIPTGISGLFIAAIFAAGISTLDSALAEVADVSVANIYEPYIKRNASDAHYLWVSRIMLVVWGGAFFALALFFSRFQAEGLLNLTFKLPNYLTGAMFGTIILARFNIGGVLEYAIGFIAASCCVWWMQSNGIGFLWWCPVSGLVMFFLSSGLAVMRNNFHPERTGII